MKLHADIEGETVEVEIKQDGERIFARVEGREYDLEVSEPEKGVFLIKSEGRIYEVFTSQPPASDLPTRVSVRGQEFNIIITDPKRLRDTGSEHSHGGGLVEIKTAMPGKVVRLLASVGDQVQKGDGVIVVEAMKMQNEMKSPTDGVVKEIRVQEGSTVNAGETLVVIE